MGQGMHKCHNPYHRDRAEERRKGLNPDYERTAMSGLPTDEALNPTMSVEETKYLGGDLEHTHLVKGLDYALLQKVSTNMLCDKLHIHRKVLVMTHDVTDHR